jgi:NAD(P)-dependent dehydrogenase (short-subunit alcohol dehydrogenase family)
MMQLPRTPSFRLDGRRALVTGAEADAGAHVVLGARTAAEIEAGAAALRDAGWSASTLRFDATEVESLDELIGAAGPFHVLVNNAGTNRPNLMVDTSVGDFDAVMDLNVRSAYFVARAVVRGMQAAGIPGSIINMSSQMGHVGGPRRTVYCASKHALEGMTKAMAVELGGSGIRVNTVCPTFIVTEMTRPYFEDEAFLSWVLGKIKLGRLGEIEDLMGPILFLASDASRLVTGASLLVDGGWTAE